MSDNKWQELLDDLQGDIKPILTQLVQDIASEAGDDIKKYAVAVSKDLSHMVVRLAGADDNAVEADLRHLRAQLTNLSVKHKIHLHRLTMQKLDVILSGVIKIAIKAAGMALA